MATNIIAMGPTNVMLKELFNKGYFIIRQAVEPKLVWAARAAINADLGNGIDPARITEFREISFCPNIRQSPPILALLKDSGLHEFCEKVVGTPLLLRQNGSIQIALRFPENVHTAPLQAHIDGIYDKNNGIPIGEFRGFTALLGIALSDVTEPYNGNFTVWAGSHRLLEKHYREVGVEELGRGVAAFPTFSNDDACQLILNAGDAIFSHHQLAHTGAPNWGADVRYMAFARLATLNHEYFKWDAVTNLWLEWSSFMKRATC